MGTFEFLSSQVEKANNNLELFKCPLCGELNEINSKRCKKCGESLAECQEVLFSEWNNYCIAFDFAKKSDFIKAFSRISIYREFYPDDIDGIRLFAICVRVLFPKEGNDYLTKIIDKTSDRWLAEFQDNPNEKLKEFFLNHKKEKYEGDWISILYDAAYSLPRARKENAYQLIDVINHIYEMHIKNISSKKPNQEYESFYEKTFLPFLSRKEINLIDFYKKNYNSLDPVETSYLGNAHEMKTNKEKLDGLIFNVYQPSIRYKTLVIQKGEIAFYSCKKD